MREAIVVDRIEGNQAMLTRGPAPSSTTRRRPASLRTTSPPSASATAPGSKVATIGVAELYGAESGIDDTGH